MMAHNTYSMAYLFNRLLLKIPNLIHILIYILVIYVLILAIQALKIYIKRNSN